MARNYISVDQVVNDFLLNVDVDDYAGHATDISVRTHALRGIRELGFDVNKMVKSIKLPVESNDTVELPDDFVDYIKIGVVGSNGVVYVLGENKNINQSMTYVLDSSGNPIDSDDDGVFDRVESKGPTNSGSPNVDLIENGLDSFVFRNYLYDGGLGALYGFGGGKSFGQFRMNLEQNRVEISGNTDASEIVMEYISDEARSSNPVIHVYAEEALMAYIYYKIVERKASVPASEKARARSEYYNERRKANARMKSVSKDDILKTIRKNFKQSPKY
jgi:hypothetical protein